MASSRARDGAANAEGVWNDTRRGHFGPHAEFGVIFKWAGAHLKNEF